MWRMCQSLFPVPCCYAVLIFSVCLFFFNKRKVDYWCYWRMFEYHIHCTATVFSQQQNIKYNISPTSHIKWLTLRLKVLRSVYTNTLGHQSLVFGYWKTPLQCTAFSQNSTKLFCYYTNVKQAATTKTNEK